MKTLWQTGITGNTGITSFPRGRSLRQSQATWRAVLCRWFAVIDQYQAMGIHDDIAVLTVGQVEVGLAHLAMHQQHVIGHGLMAAILVSGRTEPVMNIPVTG